MTHFSIFLTIIAFVLTVTFVMWRPSGLNEAIPATIGAALVLLSGSVSGQDLLKIGATVSGAAITIMATIVMAIVLESFGFFHYAAELLAERAKNSGIRLFWYVNLLCFLMTFFFNNDGSILITTPILLILLKKLGLRTHQQVPYLLSGALIATASSTPIGVSNIVNLISLKLIGMNLNLFTAMMFVPAMFGLALLLMLLFLYFRKELPHNLEANRQASSPPQGPLSPRSHEKWSPQHRMHPLRPHPSAAKGSRSGLKPVPPLAPMARADAHPFLTTMGVKARSRFIRNVFLYVFGVRVSLFIVAFFGAPVAIAAVIGALVLLLWRWIKLRVPPKDILWKTPWHTLIFVFGMYVVIYGLYKIDLPTYLVYYIRPLATGGLTQASLTMGVLVTIMSNLFNNHPALLIGTLTLTQMGFTPFMLQVAYLGNVVGSDMGSLLLPIGTLATLIWMHILKQNHVKITWRRYIGVTMLVIPVTVLFTILFLSSWVGWLF